MNRLDHAEEGDRFSENLNGTRKKIRFSISSILIATTLIAITIRWPILSYLLTPFLPGLLLVALLKNNFRRLRYLTIIGAVYLPAIQGFFAEGSHCRKVWPELFPVASGILPTIWVVRHFGFDRLGMKAEYIAAAFFLILFIIASYFFAGINKATWIIAVIITLVLSTFSSYILVAVLHA